LSHRFAETVGAANFPTFDNNNDLISSIINNSSSSTFLPLSLVAVGPVYFIKKQFRKTRKRKKLVASVKRSVLKTMSANIPEYTYPSSFVVVDLTF
jgi:hypothetical protein